MYLFMFLYYILIHSYFKYVCVIHVHPRMVHVFHDTLHNVHRHHERVCTTLHVHVYRMRFKCARH